MFTLLISSFIVIQTQTNQLKSWTIHSSMPKKATKQLVGYDTISNKIWLIGGQNNSDGSNGILHEYVEFDIKSHRFTSHHNSSIKSFASGQSYVTINSTVYNYFGQYMHKFNMLQQTFNSHAIRDLNITLINPCVATDGDRYIMLVGGMNNTWKFNIVNTFFIYDLFEKKWLRQGPSLKTARSIAGCLVAYDNYLYVFGGVVNNAAELTTDQIEKIDVSNMTNVQNMSWEVVNDTLTRPNSQMGVIESNGYIYIIGGASDQYTFQKTVDIFNISSNKISNGTSLPFPTINFAITENSEYIYLFGGTMNGNNAAVSKWTASNNLLSKNHQHTFWDLLFSWKGFIVIGGLVMLLFVAVIIHWKRKKRKSDLNLQAKFDFEEVIAK